MPIGVYKRSNEQLNKLKEQGFQKGNISWNKNRKGIMPIPWNKGKEGLQKANSGSFKNGHTFWLGKKRPNISGKNSSNWKGNEVGYLGLHSWVNRQLGKPKICKHCDATCKEKRLEWANENHKYKRNLTDWIPLCVLCHRKYDKGTINI